jgi:hypothetical protein
MMTSNTVTFNSMSIQIAKGRADETASFETRIAVSCRILLLSKHHTKPRYSLSSGTVDPEGTYSWPIYCCP